ncbi:hypothetical protein MMC14_009124 [Varicellaria rhodocarpa]|nr:hypothetical protein [Varicellaria rhodocarpa]
MAVKDTLVPIKTKKILFDQLTTNATFHFHKNAGEFETMPFEFTFPYEAEPSIETLRWLDRHTFHGIPDSFLPPTSVSRDGLHSITYQIQAVVSRPFSILKDGGKNTRDKDTMHLYFHPITVNEQSLLMDVSEDEKMGEGYQDNWNPESSPIMTGRPAKIATFLGSDISL